MKRCYCKKDFGLDLSLNKLFRKGCIYECKVSNGIVWVRYDKDNDKSYMFITNYTYSSRYVDYFYDYFCSIKKSRRDKLKELYGI